MNWYEMYYYGKDRQRDLLQEADRLRTARALRQVAKQGRPCLPGIVGAIQRLIRRAVAAAGHARLQGSQLAGGCPDNRA